MHSNKLKRKLADLGVEPSGRQATENFCLIGTPLPPLDKAKDTGEFVPLWKQDVRDEKGRRRLHGAFTGGFSAGYYNTVGSAEGWSPSTFVSSRSDRAKQKPARAEDFMDEEDLAERAADQKLVDTTDTSATPVGPSAEGAEEDPTLAKRLESLFTPAHASVGARLLSKMGWKPGHGIGPKLTHAQRVLQDQQAASASGYLPTTTTSGDGAVDAEAAKHMYPPRDTQIVSYARKDNSFGVGYEPGARLQTTVNAERKGPKISAGFGLGALNDADEDDLDVYDGSTQARDERRHMAFDDSELDGQHASDAGFRKPGPKTKTPAKAVGGPKGFFKSGMPILEGFELSRLTLGEDEPWFDLPRAPKGWQPNPREVWKADALAAAATVPAKPETETTALPTAFSSVALPAPRHAPARKPFMSAEQRGALLGETPLPSAPKSVFDYLAPKDRERLQNLASSGTAKSDLPSDPSVKKEDVRGAEEAMPTLDANIAKAALSGFQPFLADPAKAARYTTYLKSQLPSSDPIFTDAAPRPVLKPAPGQPAEAYVNELREFAKSAGIFKPASGVLGGRFASARVVEALDGGKEGLHVPSSDAGAAYLGDAAAKREEEEQRREAERRKREEMDPKIQAAKLGMFGPLTRDVVSWMPAKLLCKRFGVKEPVPENPADALAQQTQAGENDWKALLPSTDQRQNQGMNDDAVKAASASFRGGVQAKSGRDISNIGLGEDDEQGKNILTYVKPERDIFKAIFESDGSDSENEDEVDEKDEGPTPMPGTTATESTPMEVEVAKVPEGHKQGKDVEYAPRINTVAGSVDISTFKPTFTKKAIQKGDVDPNDKERKEKKKRKDAKKGKAILSFGDDVEGEMPSTAKTKKSKAKSKRHLGDHQDVDTPPAVTDRDSNTSRILKNQISTATNAVDVGGGDDDDEWVEKPVPAAAQGFVGVNGGADASSAAAAASVERPAAVGDVELEPIIPMEVDDAGGYGERPSDSAAKSAKARGGRVRAADFM